MNKPFAKRFNAPRLSPEQAERQGRASKTAIEALPSADAIAFLNTHDDALGGRPIDVAVASAEGLTRVEAAVAARCKPAA
jgi:hypothetical protein